MDISKNIIKIISFLSQLICITIAVGILIYYFGYAEEINIRIVSKVVIVLFAYLISVLAYFLSRGPLGYKVLAEKYEDVIYGGFTNNKYLYNRLMKAVSLYDRNHYKKALHILDKLEKKCEKTKDYTAVYFMKAKCYRNQQLLKEAITSYETLLQYDMNHSVVWSNLGLLYQDLENMDKAYEAYSNAIRSNPMNYYAYNNMAMYYNDIGNWKEAEYYALKALEIEPNMFYAMEKLAIAYKMTGDNEQFEKYRKLYAINGGDVKQLDAYLASI